MPRVHHFHTLSHSHTHLAVLYNFYLVLQCRLLGMYVQRKLYEGVGVLTALYGSEAWNVGAAERRRLNVMEVRCLRSVGGVT